jgi:NAD-dependent dihydropyrimidine dehydrogenase PreA subunit
MTTEFDYEKCTRCRRCYELCPLDIIAWSEADDRPYVKYPDECQLCFICQVECPTGAVKVKIPPAFW